MKTKQSFFALIILLFLTGCIPLSDCTHNFIYKGTVEVSDSNLYNNLLIRFDNLGSIIFQIQDRRIDESSEIDSLGSYTVVGDFFTSCDSDEDIFDDWDSLSYEIVCNDTIIKSRNFGILDLEKQYRDSAYFTTILIPKIVIK